MPRRPHRPAFHPGCERLEARDLPASGLGWVALGLTVYQSAPVATLRTLALGCNLGKLAWTGRAKFAFGLVLVAQPFPLGAWKRLRTALPSRRRWHRIDEGSGPPRREFGVRVGPIAVAPTRLLKPTSPAARARAAR